MNAFKLKTHPKILILTLGLFIYSLYTSAQISREDLVYLLQENASQTDSLNNKAPIQVLPFNPISWLASGVMIGYQNIISPQLLSNCPYQISCSNFAKRSISEFGLTKGVFIAADRLSRCNHFVTNAYTPIRVNTAGKITDFPIYYRWH